MCISFRIWSSVVDGPFGGTGGYAWTDSGEVNNGPPTGISGRYNIFLKFFNNPIPIGLFLSNIDWGLRFYP